MDDHWKCKFEHIFLTLTSIGQIILSIIFYKRPVSDLLRNLGWVCLWISAVFGWLPILTFKKFGGVKKGKSYVHTEKLVEKGVYSIVRHPQYLAGILISIGLFMIAPHWANLTLGIINAAQYIYGTYQEDKNLIEKFGGGYKDYIRRVPRLNFILGILRKIFG